MHEVVGLFPTPFMRVPRALNSDLVGGLSAHFSAHAGQMNNSSSNLVHTSMLKPSDSPLLVEAATVITPIPANGVGEIAYVQGGSRYSGPAREEEGIPVAGGSTVTITRIVGTQFYVRLS